MELTQGLFELTCNLFIKSTDDLWEYVAHHKIDFDLELALWVCVEFQITRATRSNATTLREFFNELPDPGEGQNFLTLYISIWLESKV